MKTKFSSAKHRKAVMANVKKFQRDGFTAYSLNLRKKVHVSPDTIKVERRKLPSGKTSIIVIGKHKGSDVSRIVGQVT